MKSSSLFISATEARNNFFALLEKVKRGPYPINITVKGIPKAVIMNKDDFESWLATIETLSDPELMKSIYESEKDFKAGRYSDWEEVKKELDLENYLVADKGKKKYVSGKTIKSSKKRPKKA
ncbi:type II toxin-antitoxin system Phd/YefM family antitoxin [Candidatus Microgenomates bacterium]|nr:type II toxin-antitoxin system Phd/YefM family antitoxin [Candidatus Microgenomates bacterium]